jgi:Mrp family chromosome partitioning ATPase/capsular polysaccharide biosynthesis protein
VRDALPNRPTTAADYLAILRRRKWIIVALPVVAALSAFVVSHSESPLYQATATVLVNRTSIVSAIAGVSDPTALGDPTRFLTTQANVARSPALAERVARSAGIRGVSGGDVLAASHVTPQSNADLLDVAVNWDAPDQAVRLANAYATEYTRYKTELDTNKIEGALAKLRVSIAALRRGGAAAAPSLATLLQQQSQLETVGTLLANNTSVLQKAEGAAQIRPRPFRRAVLGGLLGLVLGIALAFLAEALDRRVRSEEELEDTLQLPLIGRIPTPSRQLRDVNDLVTLAEPQSVDAESFRKLKTSLEFLNLDREARTIMVTSALPREGKSTTIANLAVAFARSGRRVVLVDLDLRRPFLHRFFHTGSGLGITDVVTGNGTLAGALHPLTLTGAGFSTTPPSRNGRRRTASRSSEAVGDTSTLSLLPAGTIPSEGHDALVDLVENARLTSVLEELASQADLVLVDTPPLLAVGDALALSAKVDALVLVLHSGIERPVVHELARQLQSSQAPVLGFILTGIAPEGADGYRYAYGNAYGFEYGYGQEVSPGDAAPPGERRAGRL